MKNKIINMKNNKIFIIVSICILCLAVTGGTYALWKEVLFNDFSVNTITNGLDYYINYTKGQDITSGTLNLSSDYTGGNSADIELWKKDNTYDIYGHIYLDVNTIGVNASESPALKYALVNNGNVVSEGSLKGNTSGSSIILKGNILLSTTKQIYMVYVWLDENEEVNNDMESEALSLVVRCEATMEEINALK